MAKTYFRQLKLPLEIRKSNDLVRAEIHVQNNPLANKLFAALIRAINPSTFPDISACHIEELIPTMGMDGGHQYALFKEACKALLEATVEMNNGIKNLKNGKFILMKIVTDIEYDNGKITATFNRKLKPHLLNLHDFYTKLNFFELISLKGFYTPRLYELLKSWETLDSKLKDIYLEDKEANIGLYHSLSFPESLQNNYNHIKKILEQAHKEITGKTNLQYFWEPLKRARKVVAIRFYFGGEKQRARIAHTYADKKRSIRSQSQKNNTLAKLVLACMKEHELTDGSGQSCQDERAKLAHCKLCAKWRKPIEEARLF